MTRCMLILAASLAATAGGARADEFPSDASPVARAPAREAYAAAGGGRLRVSAIEVVSEATVNDANVTLRQICRWPEADAAAFEPFADLIVARLGTRGFATITMETLRSTLRDAGLAPSRVNFAGSTSCTITRADVAVDEAAALQAWGGEPAKREIVAAAKPEPGARRETVAPAAVDDLKSRLTADVAERLHLPVDTLQIDFKPEDRRILSMGAPFEFGIDAQRYGDLGEVSWLVTISGNGKPVTPKNDIGDGKRVRIVATARAWMDQAVTTKSIATRTPIEAGDVESRRVLADHLPGDGVLTAAQAVGQQAARDVRAGTVLSPKLVAPAELVRPGQLVTILSRRGVIEVKSVARAMQAGTQGQSIRVKNETTGELFNVTMTGKQTAELGDATPSVADAR